MPDRVDMTGLFIDISDYITDPIEEELEQPIEEEYTMVSSIANTRAWRNQQA